MKVVYDFSGHVVVVVGGASGIGRETALACSRAGATCFALDVDAEGLVSLREADDRIETLTVDIADPAACAAAVADVQHRAGRIDGLVVTSAIQRRTLIDQIDDADWQRHLDVNISGPFYLLRAVFPVMKRQRSGSIVTFTSGLASAGWPGAAAYASTKAAMVGLTKTAALELRDYGVRINALSPGLVATPVFLASASQDEIAMYERSLGISQPEEVVPTLLHLLSDASATISGNVIERRLVPRARD